MYAKNGAMDQGLSVGLHFVGSVHTQRMCANEKNSHLPSVTSENTTLSVQTYSAVETHRVSFWSQRYGAY